MSKLSANKILINEGVNIGQNGAEHDEEYLFRCFVDHPAYSQITDIESPTTFILGSTGAGKTAILRMVTKKEENTSELILQDMAMNHIACSDTILFLKSLDVELNLFFQALWKHVFCIEYIKVVMHANSKEQFSFKIGKILDNIARAKSKEKLKAFIKKNEDQFWNTIDENVIEITDNLEREFNLNFGTEIKKFVSKAGYIHNMGSQHKVQLQQRARQFLNRETLSELPVVISALSDYTRGRKDKYFITVDGLDEPWVDEGIKFELLQAMFESLKSLKKLRNFQVIVALRNDLYVRMVRETPSSSRQLEKYDDLILRIKWSKSQLRELTDKRISELFRRKYSSNNVHFDDIFVQRPDSRISSWDYIYERTLRRPRDIINFINLTLQASEGNSSVSKKSFLNGEKNYSLLRHETLVHEWSSTFSGIGIIIELLRNGQAYRTASELMESHLIEKLYNELGREGSYHSDDIWMKVNATINGESHLDPSELVQIILYRLHLIGAIGLKLRSEQPWDWIFETNRPVVEKQIDCTTKFRVHPMLYSALGIKK